MTILEILREIRPWQRFRPQGDWDWYLFYRGPDCSFESPEGEPYNLSPEQLLRDDWEIVKTIKEFEVTALFRANTVQVLEDKHRTVYESKYWSDALTDWLEVAKRLPADIPVKVIFRWEE